MNSKIYKILRTSILKTLRFNIHYFGLKYIFKPIALIARGVKIKSLKGNINVFNNKIGLIKIGYPCSNTTVHGEIELNGTINVHDKLWLSRGAILEVGKSATLEIGTLTVTGNTKISCRKKIVIEDAVISWGGVHYGLRPSQNLL